MKHIVPTIAFLLIVVFARCHKEAEAQEIIPMTVRNYENHVSIDFFNDNKNMQLSFYRCGINQLFGIAKVSYYSSLSDHLQKHPSGEFTSVTDWIGPYYVCSASSAQAGLAKKFTGGWHGSNGDGTGNPTAQTTEVRISADGETSDSNFDRSCQQVDLTVVNLIHGYDFELTNKNLLKESVHYTVKSNRNIDVEVQIEALDDLVIQRYYGLQSQNFAIFDSVKYLAGNNIVNTAAINTNSSCKSNNGLNAIMLANVQNMHRLILTLNTTEGLGATSNYLGAGIPRAFSANYRKSYFNLVNGQDLSLKKGEMVFWKGSYQWE
jgi:hypothetical protein